MLVPATMVLLPLRRALGLLVAAIVLPNTRPRVRPLVVQGAESSSSQTYNFGGSSEFTLTYEVCFNFKLNTKLFTKKFGKKYKKTFIWEINIFRGNSTVFIRNFFVAFHFFFDYLIGLVIKAFWVHFVTTEKNLEHNLT